MLLAALLLAPGVATLWTVWEKLGSMVPPDPVPLGMTGAGALAVNLVCGFTLARFRRHTSSLIRAAYLSARNDAVANVAIIAAGVVTALTVSVWPDVVVGLGIFAMNLDAAREVLTAAQSERAQAKL